ncbi:MAG: substrate-binding domain-containing protein [Prevotella sp.]|nr:substrate-binding domain-containing protein [Prevotella sp.]MBP3511807.1 substrate-binding domain-containing protein [Prevotella sp.]
MAADKIRIKDIAKLSGVSVGTVDRVLHDRPNVSSSAREKVEKALKEMDYHPNVYASALAYNKTYNFHCIIPKHESEAYWEEIEEGAADACDRRRDFHVSMKMMYYNRFDNATFTKVTTQSLKDQPDGVIIVPSTLDATRKFTDMLHENGIPFILLDSYMPDLKPLSFYGQDSFCSGYFAGRMLMLIASKEKEIMLMKQMKNGNVASKQQENRETGFRHYMRDHFPHVKIEEVNLPLDEARNQYTHILENFFKAHPNIHHCITFNSKAHLVGEFLLRSNRRNVQIMGYDMVNKNAECVRQGSISFLIAQHAYMQGFLCIESLFEAIVLKKKVNPINYMPIEILTKENLDFYRRKQL